MSEEIKNNVFNIIVDRIEGDYAVCQFPDLSMKDIELSHIPFEVKSRDVIFSRYTDENKMEFISVKKCPKKIRISSKFIRFT